MQIFKETGGYGLDTETTGLHAYKDDEMFSLILADSQRAYYFNFQEYEDLNKDLILDKKEVLSHLEEAFKNPDSVWFMHNAKFDMHMLNREFPVDIKGRVHDTMVTARLIYNQHMSYSLDACLKRIGKAKDDTVKAHIKKFKLFEWESIPGKKTRTKKPFYNKVPFDIISRYGEVDGEEVRFLGMYQLQKIREAKKESPSSDSKTLADIYHLECEVTKVLFDMERTGIKIDTDYIKKAIEDIDKEYIDARVEWAYKAGSEFVDSKKYLKDYFGDSDTYDKDFMDSQTGTDKNLAILVTKIRESGKQLNTYFRSFLYHADKNNVIHPSFNQSGTVTGRMCLAKGTLIDIVRDVSKYPDGIPIEDIKVGDMAYCYDDNLQLSIKPVKWSGKTGHKKIIRIHWDGQGNKHKGYLDCTPEHEIRLIDGSYKRAKDLMPKDRILALGRSSQCGYSRLHSKNKEIIEHRFIHNFINESSFETIHHINHNKKDNRLENLAGMSRAEHSRLHAKELSIRPHIRIANSKRMKDMWSKGKFKIKLGKDNHNYIHISKTTLLRDLAEGKGRPTKRRKTIKDFQTYKNKCLNKNIDISAVSKRYGSNGYISKGTLLRSLNLSLREQMDLAGVGYYRLKEIKDYYGIDTNHRVTSIEQLNIKVDVYDLEIEKYHNFIANELCVHNSCRDPNLQNQSKSDKDTKWPIRRAFVPRKDHCLVMIDYEQMEYRLLLEYAQENDLIDQVLGGLDVHKATADSLHLSRKDAKNLNFGLVFGQGIALMAKTNGWTEEESRAKRNLYFSKLPGVRKLTERLSNTAKFRKEKYVKNWMGRRCYFPDSKFSFRATNHVIQGGCADIVKEAMVKSLKYTAHILGIKMILQIHDELLFEVHKDDIHHVETLAKIMSAAYPAKRLPMEVSIEHSWTSWEDKIDGLPAIL